jgi:hypothetical protein
VREWNGFNWLVTWWGLMNTVINITVFWDVKPCSLTDINISEEPAAFTLMMEGVDFHETSINIYQITLCHIS